MISSMIPEIMRIAIAPRVPPMIAAVSVDCIGAIGGAAVSADCTGVVGGAAVSVDCTGVVGVSGSGSEVKHTTKKQLFLIIL